MFNDSFLMIHFCRASNWECEILPLLKYTKPNSTGYEQLAAVPSVLIRLTLLFAASALPTTATNY